MIALKTIAGEAGTTVRKILDPRVVVVLSAIASSDATCEGVIEGGYQVPPLPYVTIYPGGPTTPGTILHVQGVCQLYGQVWDRPGPGRRSTLYTGQYSELDASGKRYCMGVQIAGKGVGDPRATAELVFDRMKAGVKVPYWQAGSSGSWTNVNESICLYAAVVGIAPYPAGQTVYFKKHGATMPGWPDHCTPRGVPKPVLCSIVGRGEIVHQTASVGTVYRRNKVTLGVECDGTASVVLDVPRNPAVLRTENKQIESGIYLNRDGVYSATVTAAPHGSVDVISVVNTDVKFAGTYNGSVVVTATWD